LGYLFLLFDFFAFLLSQFQVFSCLQEVSPIAPEKSEWNSMNAGLESLMYVPEAAISAGM
jgi:hypothetical protein